MVNFVVKIPPNGDKMKSKFVSIFILLLVTTLSACGPAPTPTMSVADLQGTAIAQAWAAVTQTQSAMPTATYTSTPTAIPPTETPLPTSVAFPTLPLLQPLQPTLAPQGNPTTDPCNAPPPIKPNGITVPIKFINKSDGSASLSFGMFKPNAQGECGTYNFYFGKFAVSVETVLAGCYWAYANISTTPPSIAKNPQALCVFDKTKAVSIWITKEIVNFH